MQVWMRLEDVALVIRCYHYCAVAGKTAIRRLDNCLSASLP